MATIKYLHTDDEILKCWDAAFALRPHLQKEHFLLQVHEQMQDDGYQMLGVIVEENGKEVVAAFCGFRYMTKLSAGPFIYIDDLSTLPAYRGKGYGGMLLDFVHELAKKSGRKKVELDSGHQRFTAHRLYLNKGYNMTAHHFIKDL